MNIFKKLFIPNGEKQELKAYESWTVRWKNRSSFIDYKEQAEVFTTKEDAKSFAKQIEEAFKLLKDKYATDIDITKN